MCVCVGRGVEEEVQKEVDKYLITNIKCLMIAYNF